MKNCRKPKIDINQQWTFCRVTKIVENQITHSIILKCKYMRLTLVGNEPQRLPEHAEMVSALDSW